MKIYINEEKRQAVVVGHVDSAQCGAITMLMRSAAYASDFAIMRPGLTGVQIRAELVEDFHSLLYGLRKLAPQISITHVKDNDAWKAAALEII